MLGEAAGLAAWLAACTGACLGASGEDGFASGAPDAPAESASTEGAEKASSPDSEPRAADPATRTVPAQKGPLEPVKVDLVWTQFASAWDGPDIASGESYGGKIDVFAEIKGSAFGLDDSVRINVHPEFRYGGDPNAEIGLLPVNTALFYPRADGEVFDLSLNATKTWKSGTSLTVGKLNALDYVAQIPIEGGGGLSGFHNLGIALPPSAIVPANLTGALLTVPTKKAIVRLWIYDPFLQSRRSGLEDPFATGVGGLALVTVPTRFGGLPGAYTLKFTGTTRTGPPSEILPPILSPIPRGQWGYQKGTGSVTVSFQQYLAMDRDNPGKGVGIFGQAFVADGDPNPLDWSAFFGVSGETPGRPQDRFGLGYVHYSLSDELVDDLSPFVAFQDEYGVEGYYRLGLTHWLAAQANVQYINSSIAARGTALIGTLSLQTRF